MKKQILFIALFFSLAKTDGQIVFCPPGAEWHYSFYAVSENTSRNQKIKYVKDSVLGNETVKVLFHNNYYTKCNVSTNVYTLIKQKGDTVFMRSAATQHSWQILYNYAAVAGQSWTTTIYSFYSPPSLTYTVTVDSVKTTTINGFSLRRLYVTYKRSGSSLTENTAITERLGCDRFLFNYLNPAPFTDCEMIQLFLCYGDTAFGSVQITALPCDFHYYMNVQEYFKNANIKIYPNPTNDIFTININNESITGNSFLSIKDLCGREVKQVEINGLNQEPGKIDISDLANGVYILNLSNNNEIVYTGKLVKSD